MAKTDIEESSEDSIKDYLSKIGKVALLSSQDEHELAKRIEAGLYAQRLLQRNDYALKHDIKDYKPYTPKEIKELKWVIKDGEKAKLHLLGANLRLVVSLAKKYINRGMNFLDLIQEGNLGLIRAVEKFDYIKGFKFSTYATWWIRQSITRSLADQGRTIRIPVHMVEVLNKLSRAERQILQEKRREATVKEVADELGMSVQKVRDIRQYGREPISLHMPLGDDGDSEYGDLIEDEESISPNDAITQKMLRDHLEFLLEGLSEREAGVVKMRFGLGDETPKTLDQIGEAFNVTRERIRQIEAKTMAKLRHPSRSQVLRDYLG